MPRPLPLLVLASLCVAAAAARGAMDGPEAGETRTRALQRALFKTGVPRAAEPPASETSKPARPRPAPLPLVGNAASRELGLQPTTFTPYDRFLAPVRGVIADLETREADMVAACGLMRQGRAFRYVVGDPYRADSPAITATRQAGDCKAKALWLYDELGDPAALFVIGKLDVRSTTSHAWVYWRHEGRWWILDPTDSAAPLAADSVSPKRYVPYYSFGKSGAYRHPATSLTASAPGSNAPPLPVAMRAGRVDLVR